MQSTPSVPSSPAPQRAHAGYPPRGLTFDELELGLCFNSPARTVTEADIALFAGLTGDYNPLHCDAVTAERSHFRGRVAHGMLVQSIATGLGWQTGIFGGTIAALLEVSASFALPVRAGDTLQLVLEVLERDPAPGPRRGTIVLGTRVLNQHGECVLDGRWRALMLRRGRAPIELAAGAAAQHGSAQHGTAQRPNEEP